MTHDEVTRLVDTVKNLWPNMQWTKALMSLFAERARRFNITYEQANAAICELKAKETHPVRTPHIGTLLLALEALDPARRDEPDPEDDPRTWPLWRVWANQMHCPPNMSPEDVIARYALTEAHRHETIYGVDQQWPAGHRAAYTYAWHLWHQGLVETAREAIACARARFGNVPDSVFQDGVMMPKTGAEPWPKQTPHGSHP